MGHDGDGLTLVLAGKSPHVANVGDAAGIVEIGVGDVLRPYRIAGHEHRFGEVAGRRIHVFGSHRLCFTTIRCALPLLARTTTIICLLTRVLKMRNCLLALLIFSAQLHADQPELLIPDVAGRLEDKQILEASGLARSQRQADLLWIINDNGAKEIVHAIDHTGARLGEFDLKKSRNVDWEDLASFSLDGKPYLMVADIGDNDAKRDHRTLYFVEEPTPEKKGKAKLDWKIDFRYPDGPRDAEAAAVDIDKERVLILSKRDIPPRLYELPIRPDSAEEIVATSLGTIESLRRPSRQDVEYAPKTKDWHWQPVGMDISADGLVAVILTYRHVYYYRRQADQDWFAALNTTPVQVSLGNFKNAESIAFGDDKRTVFVTGENKHSRLLRIDFSGVDTQ